MGGGGGGTDIEEQTFKKDALPNLKPGYRFQEQQLTRFGRREPLLKAAQTGALGFWDQLGGLISQISGIGSELGGIYKNQLAPIINTGGRLTPEGLRTSQQQARLAASASGTTRDIGANVNEVLNNEANRQARFNTALAQGSGILGQQAGLVGQEQALQTGGLNQLLGVENARVGNFTGLTNPIVGLVGQILSGNMQSRIAEAQISAQQQAAGDAKMGSSIGGGIGAIGSIAGAAL